MTMNKVIQNYNLLQKIGQGQYGNVYKAQNTQTKSFFAVKVMSVQKFKSIPKLTQLTNNQMSILTKINHPNIIKFIQMLQTSTHFYLVYQFCNGGTLQDKIKTQKMINQNDSIHYFKQLVSAFGVLHEKRILHRDIKPSNILFHNGKLKIADFGFCKELMKEKDMTKTMVGSPIYMAPEILKGQLYDCRADIWSLGIVLYQMLYGHCPYEESSIPKLVTMIANTMLTFPKFPRVCQPLRIFIKRMLTIRPIDRIQPQEFIKYPLQMALLQKDDIPEIMLDYKGVLKFTRNNLMYLSQTLVILAPLVNQLQYLRMAFLTYKIISNVWKITRQHGIYWEQIKHLNKQHKWDDYYEQQLQSLRPYGQIVRQAMKKCDNSLKIKLQLQKDNLDSRYFIQSIKQITGQNNAPLRERLINCLLINIHYMKVLDKKRPDWQDYTTSQKDYSKKQEYCLKYARYH